MRIREIVAITTVIAFALPTLAQAPKGGPAPGGPRPGQGGPGGPGGPGGQGGRRGGGRGISVAMLPVALIDMITPLKPDQKAKITKLQDKLKADLKAATTPEARGPIMTKAAEDFKPILTKEQTDAIAKEVPNLSMVNSSRAIPFGVIGELKLTKDQYNKINGIVAPVVAQTKDLDREARRTKMQEQGPKLKTQIEAVLTPTQKAAIEKWNKDHPRPTFGGKGGPGAPGGFGGKGGPAGKAGGAPAGNGKKS